MRNLIQTSYKAHAVQAQDPRCSCYMNDAVIVAGKHGPDLVVEQISPTYQALGAVSAASLERDADAIHIHYLEEEDQLCVFSRQGDIFLFETKTGTADIIGSIDAAILQVSWSPDGDIIALATQDKLTLLTRTFETLAECSLARSDLRQSANQVSVGWGRAETQFRGKHAPRDPTLPERVDAGCLAEEDDLSVQLSWRGDGQWLAHSSVQHDRRVIRVYSREGILESTSEAVDYQTQPLSWKPNGAVIASVQKTQALQQVIFFEKNGLRHGEFTVRNQSSSVNGLHWNADGTVLAVQYADSVELYTASNYHYSLKALLPVPQTAHSRFQWHPEEPLRCHILADSACHAISFKSDTLIQQPTLINDLGLVCMIDGANLGLTPIKLANVPPPMAYATLPLQKGTPRHVSIREDASMMAVLYADSVELYKLNIEELSLGALVSSLPLTCPEHVWPLQVVLTSTGRVIVLLSSSELLDLGQENDTAAQTISLAVPSLAMTAAGDGCIVQTTEGKLELYSDALTSFGAFPEPCPRFAVSSRPEGSMAFGLSDGGKLYAHQRHLTSGVTSHLVLGRLLAYTTTTHLHFIHITDSTETLRLPAAESSDERSRQIDRGSLLVCACLTADSVTLQAPRGNLETVYPRLLVLAGIRKAIDAGDWRHAWQKAKIHRINPNIMCDYDLLAFLSQMDEFVAALETASELDIFLSALKAENVSDTMYLSTFPTDTPVHAHTVPDKVSTICNQMLTLLQEKYRSTHLTSILTAHLSKQPADPDSALLLVSALREHEREEAIQHMCFLADAHQLHQRALGLYDLKLALLLAQQSQKDPREYVPFLQSIQRLTPLRQKFTLDDHLERYGKALCSLLAMTPSTEYWQEALRYIRLHQLWDTCLAALRSDRERYLIAVAAYAQELEERRDFSEAGAAFELVGKRAEASHCYTLSGHWQEALQTALLADLDTQTLAQRLADDLVEQRRFTDAAVVYRDWLHDPDAAIRFFGQAFDFTSSLLLAGSAARIDQLVKPTLREGFSHISALLAEMKSQLEAQLPRLAEVRQKRLDQPDDYFDGREGGEDAEQSGAPDNVSLAGTDATSSTQHSMFTRYTDLTGKTGSTSMSRRSGKAKRRMERQRARGKKGTIWEEEYLVNSIRRLMERLESNVRHDARKLVMGLVRCGMLVEAGEVQKAAVSLIHMARESMDAVFVGILTLPQELQRAMGERPVLQAFEVTTLVAS
ncbi:IKI3 family-domain-containing protein [Protomyces lactucae-debilis]|uniref:Elongator complex protein 1 n=1 Tax=Protomyces lactucae-debilis TaxID=2754530 RepID=A0A1Y2EUI5_PROLT|nr:IKI3 family-domain-containing protein [Protomyces lactucae-debilis]ORY74826.1 IKI3 family-domain-containing protein [Protomyces lactucae-debilis]